MDVNAIRADLAAALTSAGYLGYAYAPEAIKQVPACVVNVPESTNYHVSLGLASFELTITVVVQANSYEQGQAALDTAMSTGVTSRPGSVVDALLALTSNHIQKLEVLGADNGRLVEKDNLSWLALDIHARVTARK